MAYPDKLSIIVYGDPVLQTRAKEIAKLFLHRDMPVRLRLPVLQKR